MRRVQRAIANTVVGQMLPAGVVKGGTALKLRVGGERQSLRINRAILVLC